MARSCSQASRKSCRTGSTPGVGPEARTVSSWWRLVSSRSRRSSRTSPRRAMLPRFLMTKTRKASQCSSAPCHFWSSMGESAGSGACSTAAVAGRSTATITLTPSSSTAACVGCNVSSAATTGPARAGSTDARTRALASLTGGPRSTATLPTSLSTRPCTSSQRRLASVVRRHSRS